MIWPLKVSSMWEMPDPDIPVRCLKGQYVAADGCSGGLPGEHSAFCLNITGNQITRSIHIYITHNQITFMLTRTVRWQRNKMTEKFQNFYHWCIMGDKKVVLTKQNKKRWSELFCWKRAIFHNIIQVGTLGTFCIDYQMLGKTYNK